MSGVHYKLDETQTVVRVPPATDSACIAYLMEKEDAVYLCVMEGAAYHQFKLTTTGASRLAHEAADLVRKFISRNLQEKI